MAELRIRNVDDQVVALLKARADREGASLSGTIRRLLEQEAMRPRAEMLERLDRLHRRIVAEHGVLSDSTPLIREERDRRG